MMGETVFVDGVAVGNVLVEPGQASDLQGVDIPAGTVIAYTLRFPADYCHAVSDADITVRGTMCRSVGHADHLRPAQVFGSAWSNPWDMSVLVRAVPGEMTARIRVIAVAAHVDALGDEVAEERIVWEGEAQARMESGSVHPTDAREAASDEVWHFVAPWQDGFATLRTQATSIEYAGARYAAQSIKDIDGQHRFGDFKAVRHG